MLRLLVVRKIVGDDLSHMEIVRKLKGKYRIENLLFLYFLNIFFRAQFVGIFVIIRNASAKHNSLQVQRFAKIFPVIVHAACKPESAVFGVDKNLNAIEDIAIGLMGIESFVTCYGIVGMVIFYHIVIYNDRQGATHYFFVGHCHYLPFGKYCYQFFNLSLRPEDIAAIGISSSE